MSSKFFCRVFSERHVFKIHHPFCFFFATTMATLRIGADVEPSELGEAEHYFVHVVVCFPLRRRRRLFALLSFLPLFYFRHPPPPLYEYAHAKKAPTPFSSSSPFPFSSSCSDEKHFQFHPIHRNKTHRYNWFSRPALTH